MRKARETQEEEARRLAKEKDDPGKKGGVEAEVGEAKGELMERVEVVSVAEVLLPAQEGSGPVAILNTREAEEGREETQ